MALMLKEVRQRCVGSCQNQNVFINLDGRFYSLSAFFQTVIELARETRLPELTRLLSAVTSVWNKLTELAHTQGVTLTQAEKGIIRQAFTNFQGKCELYFVLEAQEPTQNVAYRTDELVELYKEKERKAATAEQRSHYSYIHNQLTQVLIDVLQLKNTLLRAQAVLQRLGKPISPEERARRGYNLSEEQRVRANLDLLRGKFEETRSDFLTMGRYFSVPGMYQDHVVLAIDTLTGMIFPASSAERHATFLSASYEAQETDAITCDYVFASRMPGKEQIVILPTGYRVLPLKLLIFERDKLSKEAEKVVKETEFELFAPVLDELGKARKRIMDPEMLKKLLDLKDQYGL